MTQLSFYLMDGISLADLVALGATLAVGSCSGPTIPYYYGRETASGPSAEGMVPEPQHTTESHIEKFARMGFSTIEMIEAVACGHTIGGVHAAANPTVTNETFHHFDSTRSYFDNNVATEYIQDARLNPLAQPESDGLARSSDTRVFSVDKNATLQAMANDNQDFIDRCQAVFGKMFSMVPSGVQLQGPLTPYKISGSFWPNTRNGNFVLPSNTGSARLYGQKGQWASFELGYTNRDGSVGTDSSLLVVDPVREMFNGMVEVRDFSSKMVPIPPATGLGSITINVVMNDGTVLKDEGEEVIAFDDTILMDIGNEYTCKYGETGLNMSAHVLGPYNPNDKVEFLLRNGVAEVTAVPATYRGARDEYYNVYNVFIPDWTKYDLKNNAGGFGARLTRANGEVHQDLKADAFYRMSVVQKCVEGAEIPAVPSGVIARRSRQTQAACPPGKEACDGRCVNTLTDLEHCGGCDNDCSALSDGYVQCIKGRCVLGENLP